MKVSTLSIIQAACADDRTIPARDLDAALAILRGEGCAADEPLDFPLTRQEVAKLLRVSRVTVTAWAKAGAIRRVTIPGRKRALGYSRRDVAAILNGTRRPGADGKDGKEAAHE